MPHNGDTHGGSVSRSQPQRRDEETARQESKRQSATAIEHMTRLPTASDSSFPPLDKARGAR